MPLPPISPSAMDSSELRFEGRPTLRLHKAEETSSTLVDCAPASKPSSPRANPVHNPPAWDVTWTLHGAAVASPHLPLGPNVLAFIGERIVRG